MDDLLRVVYWISSSKKDLKGLPAPVQDVVGYALHLAQQGKKHMDAKPLKGFSSAGVLEIRVDHASDTFRVVYVVVPDKAIYVLHCYQKKSAQGIQTPKRAKDLIHQRLRIAYAHAEDSEHERH